MQCCFKNVRETTNKSYIIFSELFSKFVRKHIYITDPVHMMFTVWFCVHVLRYVTFCFAVKMTFLYGIVQTITFCRMQTVCCIYKQHETYANFIKHFLHIINGSMCERYGRYVISSKSSKTCTIYGIFFQFTYIIHYMNAFQNH